MTGSGSVICAAERPLQYRVIYDASEHPKPAGAVEVIGGVHVPLDLCRRVQGNGPVSLREGGH